MKDWKVGEVAAFISATAFALTVVYLYGYKIASGINLFEYLSLDDYFRLAVGWLVPVVLGCVGAVVIEAALRRSEHGMTEREIEAIIAKGPRARFWLAFRRGPEKFILVVALLSVVVGTSMLILGGPQRLPYYEMWATVGPVLWFAAVRWYERESRLVAEWTRAWRASVWFIPAMLIFSFFRGLSVAERAKVSPPGANATRVTVLGRPEPIGGHVLFILDGYVLLRTGRDGEVVAIPKAQVSLIAEGSQK